MIRATNDTRIVSLCIGHNNNNNNRYYDEALQRAQNVRHHQDQTSDCKRQSSCEGSQLMTSVLL
jgi:hypothetical protein